jgi:hypothetical protein
VNVLRAKRARDQVIHSTPHFNQAPAINTSQNNQRKSSCETFDYVPYFAHNKGAFFFLLTKECFVRSSVIVILSHTFSVQERAMNKVKKYFQERGKNKWRNNNERGWTCCRVSKNHSLLASWVLEYI